MDEKRIIDEEWIDKERDNFSSGDLIRVTTESSVGDRKRLHRFEGRVIKKRGERTGKTFTVRKVSQGIGIEKIFPLYSPVIKSIKVLKKGKVRRSKLYYLRKKEGKAARIKEKK